MFLILLGLVASADTAELGDNLTGRMLFMVLFTLAETLCFAAFIGLWLRFAKWEGRESLFGLVAVASGLQFIEPLTSWSLDDVALAVNAVLSIFGILVLVNALAVVSGIHRLRVALGVLLFAPVAMVLLAGALSLGSAAGWWICPQAWRTARAGGEFGADYRHLSRSLSRKMKQDMPRHVLFCIAAVASVHFGDIARQPQQRAQRVALGGDFAAQARVAAQDGAALDEQIHVGVRRGHQGDAFDFSGRGWP